MVTTSKSYGCQVVEVKANLIQHELRSVEKPLYENSISQSFSSAGDLSSSSFHVEVFGIKNFKWWHGLAIIIDTSNYSDYFRIYNTSLFKVLS